MVTRKAILVLSVLVAAQFQSFGQDSLSVYFEFGSAHIPSDQFQVLNSIPVNYDLSDLDSVRFVGMADSVGNITANLKLSEKRARAVSKYLRKVIPQEVIQSISALGESRSENTEGFRRVDILLYFNQRPEAESDSVQSTISSQKCFNVDYNLLHRSHVRTIIKRGKSLVLIETTVADLKGKKEHFYGSDTKTGEFIYTRVKWKTRRTGNLWWAKTRAIASIPKKDFDRYSVFKVTDEPCDSCHEDLPHSAQLAKEVRCLQVDRFLMDNLQTRTKWFNPAVVKVRVPKEYVDIRDHYFIGCDLQTEVQWDTKRGRRRKNYYFTQLPRVFDHLSNVSRLMDCCVYDPEPSECDRGLIFCMLLERMDRSFTLTAEVGTQYQKTQVVPYAGLGFKRDWFRSRVSVLAGTDIDLGFYGSVNYQFHFLSFPFSAMNPFSGWKSPTISKNFFRYARLYVGSEVKVRLNRNRNNYTEQNLHIGFAWVNASPRAVVDRIYIQYGPGFNYLDIRPPYVYSIGQVGLTIAIARIKRKG